MLGFLVVLSLSKIIENTEFFTEFLFLILKYGKRGIIDYFLILPNILYMKKPHR